MYPGDFELRKAIQNDRERDIIARLKVRELRQELVRKRDSDRPRARR